MLRRRTSAETTIFVVSLAAGLAALAVVYVAARSHGLDPFGLMGDAKGYLKLAQHSKEFGVFSFSNSAPFFPESFRAPGYPLFLSALLFLGSPLLALVAQVALVSIMPPLLYILLKPYYERAAFWGSLVFALEPIHLFYSASFLSDSLFVCLLLGSLIALERASTWKWALLCGALLGAAILVRPIALFLPILYIAYALCVHGWREWRHVVLICVAVLIVVLPWMWRNHHYFGSWQISSVSSANLVLYNAPEFLKFRPDPAATAVLEQLKEEQAAVGGTANQSLALNRSGLFVSTFVHVVNGHWGSYILFHLIKTVPFFLTDGLRDVVRLFDIDIGVMPNISTALLRGEVGTIVSYVTHPSLALVLLVAGSGFWFLVCSLYAWTLYRIVSRRLWRLAFFFVVLVAYFAVLTGPVSNARYRMPVEGFLLVAAAGALLEYKRT